MKKIFISSTFRDMNEERDLFHERICPSLNEIAREYGESVSFCDLRWGVDTTTLETEEGSRKVLSVCLDEIDRCRPYMVVLLGERYGWIPSEALMAETVQNRRDFALQELDKSVTALEIEYGALKNTEQLDRTLFYFRQMEGTPAEDYSAESERHAEKLQQLKQRITNTVGSRVKPYTVRWDERQGCICDLDDFAETVIADLRDLMEQEWQELAALTHHQKERHSHWEFAAQKGGQFTARGDLIQEYCDRLQTHPCLAVRGPSGSGKSTLLSRLSLDLNAQGNKVLPIFCGNSTMSGTAMGVLQHIVDFLESELHLPHIAEQNPDPSQWQQRLDELTQRYAESAQPPLVILIDAVDQLLPDEARDALKFLPLGASDRVKVVISCLDTFKLVRDIPIANVPQLNQADRTAIVKGILAPTGRALSNAVIDAITAKDGGDKPLYLSLLVARLEMMDRADFREINRNGGGIDAINQKQIEMIRACPTKLEDLCVELLNTATEKLGNKLPFFAANYLAMSRYGLRESDLEGIFARIGIAWDALSFSRFQRYMSRFFLMRDDGRLDFAHNSFRRGFLSATEDPRVLHETIFQHLISLHEKDDVRLRELIYHCILADQKQAFVNYVTQQENDAVIGFASENTATLALQDHGEWLRSLLEDTALTGVTHHLYSFLVLDVLCNLPESLTAVSVMQNVFSVIIEQKETLIKTSRGRVLLDVSRFKLSQAYYSVGGIENFERAESLLKQSLDGMGTEWETVDEESEELAERNQLWILYAYCQLANLYVSVGWQQKLEDAVTFLLDGLKRVETLRTEKNTNHVDACIAALCHSLASVYNRIDPKQYHREILSYSERACEIQERLDNTDTHALIARYDQVISTLVSDDPTPEEYERAFALAEKALELSREALRTADGVQALSQYASCLDTLAKLYLSREDEVSLLQALELTQSAIRAQETVLREDDTEGETSNLAIYLFAAADIHSLLGGEENLHTACELYERAQKLLEECVAVQDSPILFQGLSSGYLSEGRVLETLGGEENFSRALERYHKAVSINEEMIQILGNEICYSLLRRSISSCLDLAESQGNEEEALTYALKRAEVDRAALKAFDDRAWASRLSDDIAAICRFCSHLEEAWLETERSGYLERLALHEEWSARGEPLCGAESLWVIYNNLAWFCEKVDGKPGSADAVELRSKSYDAAKTMYREAGDDASRRVLAMVCQKLVKTYKGFASADRETLCGYAREAVVLWEQVVEQDPTFKNRLQYALALSALGEVQNDRTMLFKALVYLQTLHCETEEESCLKHIANIESLLN